MCVLKENMKKRSVLINNRAMKDDKQKLFSVALRHRNYSSALMFISLSRLINDKSSQSHRHPHPSTESVENTLSILIYRRPEVSRLQGR
jgi:hypothetical protein